MPLSKWTRLWIKLRVKVSMLYSIINVSIKNFSFSPKIRARKRIILRLQEILNALDQANYSEDGNPFYMKANIEYEDSYVAGKRKEVVVLSTNLAKYTFYNNILMGVTCSRLLTNEMDMNDLERENLSNEIDRDIDLLSTGMDGSLESLKKISTYLKKGRLLLLLDSWADMMVTLVDKAGYDEFVHIVKYAFKVGENNECRS